MRNTKIFTTDGRIWYVQETLEEIEEIYKLHRDFYVILTQTNATGSNQAVVVFLIKTVVMLKDLR